MQYLIAHPCRKLIKSSKKFRAYYFYVQEIESKKLKNFLASEPLDDGAGISGLKSYEMFLKFLSRL